MAEVDSSRQAAARTVPPRQRHRPHDLRRSRHPAAEGSRRCDPAGDGRRQHALHLRRRRRSRAKEGAVFRSHGRPRHLFPGRVVRGGVGTPHSVGCRPTSDHRAMEPHQRPMAALQPRSRLLASHRSRRPESRQAAAVEAVVRRRGESQPRLSDRRRIVVDRLESAIGAAQSGDRVQVHARRHGRTRVRRSESGRAQQPGDRRRRPESRLLRCLVRTRCVLRRRRAVGRRRRAHL